MATSSNFNAIVSSEEELDETPEVTITKKTTKSSPKTLEKVSPKSSKSKKTISVESEDDEEEPVKQPKKKINFTQDDSDQEEGEASKLNLESIPITFFQEQVFNVRSRLEELKSDVAQNAEFAKALKTLIKMSDKTPTAQSLAKELKKSLDLVSKELTVSFDLTVPKAKTTTTKRAK